MPVIWAQNGHPDRVVAYLNPTIQDADLDFLHGPPSIIRMVNIIKVFGGISASDIL